VNGDIILYSILENFPEAYYYILQSYGTLSFLAFGENCIHSQRGVQQGDPLGPFLFSLVIQPLISSLKSQFNAWYLVDGTFAGPPSVVENDFIKNIENSYKLGLELNFSKSELFFLNNQSVVSNRLTKVAPSIKILLLEQLFLLGAPIHDTNIHEAIESKINSLSLMCSRLSLLNAHQSLFLLKNAISIPRLSYLLRCSPCWQNIHDLQMYDKILKSALEEITNSKFNENS